MTDSEYMRRAISLAQRGAGYTSPNPLVGAVIVRDGQIIGEGYHERYGELHAERNALADCRRRGIDPEGAAIYVTLEPCCHYGKTPPCTEAIIENRLAKVFIGSRDPNPLVSGKGVSQLRDAGIEVITDFLREECDALNPVFFHYITEKTPYVVLKYAMTMDGKIATFAGNSRWITGEAARLRVHQDRSRLTAIMAGVETIIRDNPQLTCRLPDGTGRNPIRIVCDTGLRTPLTSQLVQTAKDVRTIIACSCPGRIKQQPYLDAGCEIITVDKGPDGHLDLRQLMQTLGEQKIDSILLEGGGRLNWSALSAGIVNKVQAYVAPKLFGGDSAKTPVGGAGVEFPDQAVLLSDPKITVIGDDILIESEVKPCSQASSKK
ncbi:MAG: bifunctional diaminohydroxyphosphoribosylaminopyrimidine deaminase/5-amino-6-(5-phosphoribosylamino)uracil reductase RibD [Emergencia sp.]